MHLKCVLFILSVIFFESFLADQSTEKIPRNNAHPNSCFVERYRMALKFNTEYPVPGKCAVMKCNSKQELTITKCRVIEDPYCRAVDRPENRGKPYPDCCPMYACA